MKEKLSRRFKDFEKALNNLESALNNIVDDLDIDGAIKRFELCYDLSWKLMKNYLESQGIIVRSPRACFKEAYQNELIEDEYEWMIMIDDRNMLVHDYTFEESRKIFNKIKDNYFRLLKNFYLKIKERIKSDVYRKNQRDGY